MNEASVAPTAVAEIPGRDGSHRSYVGSPFFHDVFVTYSHGDMANEGDSLLKQWSQSFAQQLIRELNILLGATVSVFLDQGHRPNDGIDPLVDLNNQLQMHIARSAMMIALVSPHYLKSEWCRRERDWWKDAQKAHSIAEGGRIAIARMWPVAGSDPWPPLFGAQLEGFWFYNREKGARPQPYEWPLATNESKGAFREALLSLVGSISTKLDELKAIIDAQKHQQTESAKLAAAGRVVYLHGREEQESDWRATSAALEQNGFTVVPSGPDPVERDTSKLQELRRYRIETLTGCDALLLLGSDNGRAVEADLVVVGRQDRHSARAVSKSSLPCALLDKVGGLFATPARQLIARQLQVDWIDGTKAPWIPRC
jgi:hypothetical protein